MGSDWDSIEERLVSRSEARRGALARRDRRRSWLPWFLCPLVLPAIGAAVFLWLLEDSGGDFAGRSSGYVIAVVAACWAVPALLAVAVARRNGWLEAVLWAFVCAFAQVAFAVGVGFVLLDLGPTSPPGRPPRAGRSARCAASSAVDACGPEARCSVAAQMTRLAAGHREAGRSAGL